jgi:outer membrane protein assembly factor BamD
VAIRRTGIFVTFEAIAEVMRRAARLVILMTVLVSLSACSGFNLFGNGKLEEEEIIPPDTLYQSALDDIDRQYFNEARKTLEKLERQHPYSEYAEKAKLMTVFANFRTGDFPEAILAADRYLALHPSSNQADYILYLKGTSYYAQIKDITRDQQLAQDAIDTLQLLVGTYPNSKYVDDARESIRVSYDQLAGKEMSVGRYYQGNGQHTAAINRFRAVTQRFQTTTHIEEALYRLTESYLLLGLLNEARTSAAVLGHNYPSSDWYKQSYTLLQEQGLSPEVVDSQLFGEKLSG